VSEDIIFIPVGVFIVWIVALGLAHFPSFIITGVAGAAAIIAVGVVIIGGQ